MSDAEWWVQFQGRGKVRHLVHQEQTGWSRSERAGSIIVWCGRVGNDSILVDPPTAEAECKMCTRNSNRHQGATTDDK